MTRILPESTPPAPSGSDDGWRALFSRPHRAAVVVMASGVGLYAMNLYFTAALLPSVVADVGGAAYFAWASTGYLITAVIATMFAQRILATRGPARAYVVAYLLFAAGTVLSALAPSMELFVAGRAVQGMGAGLLTGLGFAVIRGTVPEALWTRATGLISAMFGVGTLIGPALGGLFAQAGAWRVGFATLAVAALALAAVTLRALPTEKPARSAQPPVPVVPIVLLAATAAALSVSSILGGAAAVVLVGVGLAVLIAFLVVDARTAHGVLPRLTYSRGNPLKWVYLTVAAFCAGVMAENFIPLFAQQLAGLGPLPAGLLGAVLSFGWTAAQLFSVNASRVTATRLIRLGPVLMSVGILGYGLLQLADASPVVVVLWTLLLLMAGAGVGLAFPHLTVAAMSAAVDPAEGAKASAAVSTTQLITFTLASATAGNLLTLGAGSPADGARWVLLGVGVLTIPGILTAALLTRSHRRITS
jgi:MFS family permease